MELIRRNSDYALRSLLYMAKFHIGKRFTIKKIADRQQVPQAFLRKIFQRLSQGHIVGSYPGPSGGFYLLKKPSQISLRKILESVQGRVSISDCLWVSNLCRRSRACGVREGLRGIQDRLDNLLERYTLRDAIK